MSPRPGPPVDRGEHKSTIRTETGNEPGQKVLVSCLVLRERDRRGAAPKLFGLKVVHDATLLDEHRSARQAAEPQDQPLDGLAAASATMVMARELAVVEVGERTYAQRSRPRRIEESAQAVAQTHTQDAGGRVGQRAKGVVDSDDAAREQLSLAHVDLGGEVGGDAIVGGHTEQRGLQLDEVPVPGQLRQHRRSAARRRPGERPQHRAQRDTVIAPQLR